MFMQRFYDTSLAQASYLLGCERTGEAIVVDPLRDIDPYLAAAENEGLRVTHVTETHIHADFVSGSRELAHRSGARLHLSAEGGPDWQYGYAATDGATLLHDGDLITIGRIRLTVMHTPGHTPEHLAFLVTDTVTTSQPIACLTGDFVFVGDVGRPDLLERAARIEGTMIAGAHDLFRSLARFRALPDWVQVWPGHGAGSACGKSLGAMPVSTVGYERIANWALATTDEDEFVRLVLEGQPEPPVYFAEMKRINRDGPRILDVLPRVHRLPDDALARLIPDVAAGKALVVDTRSAAEFAARHVPGTINIPLNRSFTTWAGWLIPYDRDVTLLCDAAAARAAEAIRDLSMIGLDRITGWVTEHAVDAWAAQARPVESIARVAPAEIVEAWRAGAVTIVDVRGRSEWDEGHVPGALHIPLGTLAARAGEIPAGRPAVVQCQSGSRSAIAASVLSSHGRRDVRDLLGGIDEWAHAGYPVERSSPARNAA